MAVKKTKAPVKKETKTPEKVVVKNVKKITPRYTSVLTTMDIYDSKELQRQSGIIDTTKQVMSVKEFQKVIAIGDMVRGIKPGDIVAFSPKAYEKKKYQDGSLKDGIIKMNPTIDYDFPIVILDNIPYLLLQDRDITYVVNDYE